MTLNELPVTFRTSKEALWETSSFVTWTIIQSSSQCLNKVHFRRTILAFHPSSLLHFLLVWACIDSPAMDDQVEIWFLLPCIHVWVSFRRPYPIHHSTLQGLLDGTAQGADVTSISEGGSGSEETYWWAKFLRLLKRGSPVNDPPYTTSMSVFSRP